MQIAKARVKSAPHSSRILAQLPHLENLSWMSKLFPAHSKWKPLRQNWQRTVADGSISRRQSWRLQIEKSLQTWIVGEEAANLAVFRIGERNEMSVIDENGRLLPPPILLWTFDQSSLRVVVSRRCACSTSAIEVNSRLEVAPSAEKPEWQAAWSWEFLSGLLAEFWDVGKSSTFMFSWLISRISSLMSSKVWLKNGSWDTARGITPASSINYNLSAASFLTLSERFTK